MGAYGLLFKDRPDRGLHYRDLRSLQDDRTVLRNPHKGWYWHYIDNGYGRDNYRKLHDPADMLEDFPGLNHLYLRFDWGDIEKEEGVLDWSYIDEIMDKWGKAGYRFSFRVCTYEASNEGSLAFATPKWVFDAGAKYRVCGGAYEPDYGDPVFLEKLGAFMEAYGKKFNGHPLVETVDIGTFGTWGEGHTSNGSELVWPLSVMKKHIDLHAAYFPDTYLLLNDDYINHRNECGDEENLRLMDYALQRGTGLCDDSVCVEYYSRHCGYDTLRTPFMFDYFWKQAPVDLEFEHYAGMKPEVFQNGLPFLAAMMRSHATFAGFHGYPRPWLEKAPELTAYCANRLGYWYFLEGVDLPPLVDGLPHYLTFYISNRGFARGYWRFFALLRLVNRENGRCCDLPLEMDNTRWMPGETAAERVRILPRGLEPGSYDVFFGLFDGERPVELGMNPSCRKDGFYRLTSVQVSGD